MNVHSSIIVIAKMVEITKCPSIDWINTLWSIHTMQDYSAKKKKNGVLMRAIAWMNLGSKLSEKEASHKGPQIM